MPERTFQLNALGVGSRGDRGACVFDHGGQISGLHFQSRLAEDDARDVEHVFHNLREGDGIPIDHFERLRNLLFSNGA